MPQHTINTQFYTIDQNNSGGYFVEDDAHGVAEYVIIEALSPQDAWNRLEAIGEKVDGFWAYCQCCGKRWWNSLCEEDGKGVPSIWDRPIEQEVASHFRKRAFIHYLDGSFKEHKFVAAPLR